MTHRYGKDDRRGEIVPPHNAAVKVVDHRVDVLVDALVEPAHCKGYLAGWATSLT